jgi:hypothetical protein
LELLFLKLAPWGNLVILKYHTEWGLSQKGTNGEFFHAPRLLPLYNAQEPLIVGIPANLNNLENIQ